MLLGASLIIICLLNFLEYRNPLNIYEISAGLFFVILGVSGIEWKYKKSFYLMTLGLISFMGIVLLFIGLFSIESKDVMFNVALGTFILFIFVIFYLYLKNRKLIK